MAITSFSPDERIEVYVTVARKKILKKCNFTRGRKITLKIRLLHVCYIEYDTSAKSLYVLYYITYYI
jgi:hypothetical protein